MCGRYAQPLEPIHIRRRLAEDNMSAWHAPDDDGDDAPHRTHNFAPGDRGLVYRADTPDRSQGSAGTPGGSSQDDAEMEKTRQRGKQQPGAEEQKSEHAHADTASSQAPGTATTTTAAPKARTQYRLQTMKWGLVPSWRKRGPDHATLAKTINCRDDSLAAPGGLWASMKARKRCVVIATGFYEWLAKGGGKTKVPHHVKRRDGRLMCLAGLWDCVHYEGGNGAKEPPLYSYTIITTDSNKQLRFLHDRMPVILEPGSDAMRTWLDPARTEWSEELQRLLAPYAGELEVYPVTQEVGRVGTDSPSFVIPVDSKENKRNIANFFANTEKKGGGGGGEGGGGGNNVEGGGDKEDWGADRSVHGEREKISEAGKSKEEKEGEITGEEVNGHGNAGEKRPVPDHFEEDEQLAKRLAAAPPTPPPPPPPPSPLPEEPAVFSKNKKTSATSSRHSGRGFGKAKDGGAGRGGGSQKITAFFSKKS